MNETIKSLFRRLRLQKYSQMNLKWIQQEQQEFNNEYSGFKNVMKWIYPWRNESTYKVLDWLSFKSSSLRTNESVTTKMNQQIDWTGKATCQPVFIMNCSNKMKFILSEINLLDTLNIQMNPHLFYVIKSSTYLFILSTFPDIPSRPQVGKKL